MIENQIEKIYGTLGIGLSPAPASQNPVVVTLKEQILYLIKAKEEVRGPFTVRQLVAMWESGGITADAECSSDRGASWSPLLTRMEAFAGGEGGSAIDSLTLQQALKNNTVAVLLAIFIPFVGAFYGSPMAAIVPFFTGAIAGLVSVVIAGSENRGINDGTKFLIFILIAGCFAVWSLFWSLRAVAEHNESILKAARGRAT